MHAQKTDTSSPPSSPPFSPKPTSEIEEVIVTGSRLKRDTYSSIAPLQIINAEAALDRGLIDPSQVLQNISAANGTQIDLSFSDRIQNNGPGAATINLRGLGPNRALVLINGRRAAPAGVEGAPSAPDLNMVPSLLVDKYDIVLDGASSVYGSDAVSGVSNVILRRNFNGLELNSYIYEPTTGSGGLNQAYGITWGTSSDNGLIGFGAEFNNVNATTYSDRAWTADCTRHVEITEEGEIRSNGFSLESLWNTPNPDACLITANGRRVFIPPATGIGTIFYDPERANSGIGDFSFGRLNQVPVDLNQDGTGDINQLDYTVNGSDAHSETNLFPDQEYIRMMSYGEYNFEGDMEITPYFEALYAQREISNWGLPEVFFPRVPPTNPFNPCRGEEAGGVDCSRVYNEFIQTPEFVRDYVEEHDATPEEDGLILETEGPLEVEPVVFVRGDRNITESKVRQGRFVSGVRGQLPQLNIGSLSDWYFDFSNVISYSYGESSRPGIRNDRLRRSLNTTIEDPNNPGNFICGVDEDDDDIPDGNDGCVPINMFAPSLYEPLVGDFATPAERDYLFDSRDFTTEYWQNVATVFVGGTVAELPAGSMSLGFGLEYRYDRIRSTPDDVASEGLFFSFFTDRGASGAKYSREAYIEAAIPLLADLPWASSLELELAGRFVDDQFYGGASTYSAKLGYRPVDWVTLRATRGTSYRAPNVRELFLNQQTSFINVTDPCAVPLEAVSPTGEYVPSEDMREEVVLNNCERTGVDPRALIADTLPYSIQIGSGGIKDLDPETSTSITAGFSLYQPWFDSFEFNLGATYWELTLENTIIEPFLSFIIGDCYNNPSLNSVFCSRIDREERSNGNRLISLVRTTPLNRDSQEVNGVDLNLDFSKDFTLFSKEARVSAGLQFTNNREFIETFLNDEGNEITEDSTGAFGLSKWTGTSYLTGRIGDFSLTWSTYYISSVEQPENEIGEFSNIEDFSQTCFGPDEGDVNCRDVGFAGDYLMHNLSASYRSGRWGITAGLRNIFNEAPPTVDPQQIRSISNAPIGFGYNLDGRSFFLRLYKSFGKE